MHSFVTLVELSQFFSLTVLCKLHSADLGEPPIKWNNLSPLITPRPFVRGSVAFGQTSLFFNPESLSSDTATRTESWHVCPTASWTNVKLNGVKKSLWPCWNNSAARTWPSCDHQWPLLWSVLLLRLATTLSDWACFTELRPVAACTFTCRGVAFQPALSAFDDRPFSAFRSHEEEEEEGRDREWCCFINNRTHRNRVFKIYHLTNPQSIFQEKSTVLTSVAHVHKPELRNFEEYKMKTFF